MKRTAMFLTVLFTLSLFSGLVQAQELTLDDCIDLALKNRASIIRARGAESQASAAKLSALGAFLPRISGSYSYSKGKETSITPPSTRALDYVTVLDTTVVVIDTLVSDTAIDAVQIPTSFAIIDEQDTGPSKSWSASAGMSVIDVSNWFNLSAASAAKASAHLNVLASEQDLIYSVKISYYAYLASVENVSVQEEAAKRAEEQLKLIQSRFDLGSASKSDVLKQKVLFGNDRLGLLRAQNGVTNARAGLAYTIGLDPREDHQFATNYRVREYSGTLDDAISFGLTSNPGLLAKEKSFDEARHTVKAAKAGYLPSLSVSARYQKFNGTQAYPVSFDYSSNSYSYGFSVSWNIFDGFFREQQVTSAKINRNNARANLADTRNLTVSNVKTGYLDIAQLKEQKQVSQENVEAAEEDLR
ncbi:MAG: TolC family protein, partial [Proteobacteria bacterium]|nr:TolC family protein [Pseudomonadota bacterium]